MAIELAKLGRYTVRVFHLAAEAGPKPIRPEGTGAGSPAGDGGPAQPREDWELPILEALSRGEVSVEEALALLGKGG